MIKTVIFDLGRVIVPFDFQRGYSRMAAACGLTPEEVRARIHALDIVVPYESGHITSEDFVARVLDSTGAAISFDEFSEIWSSVFLPETLLTDSMVESVKRSCRLVLLSNTNDIHFRMIRESYPILRHFDEFVLSYEVGAMKPDPRIYARAIEAARCEPGECFFTDDVPAYVEGAVRAGIDAVVFENCAATRAELQKRGVETLA
jgi:putative hydrolase of the HAD superfamily